MCGISGYINLKEDLSYQPEIIDAMSQTLANRGPDASGKWVSQHALIGHRRLSIVDPAGGGQPMIKRLGEKEYVITYNGELYNTLELRRELEIKGYIFTSNCDTEVLLTSYIEWGPECVERLNGIFAFGIWNEYEKSLFLARDRFGVKPLFYSIVKASLIFASELKALLAHPQVNAILNSEGLSEIFVLGPSRTPGHGIFCGISELKPAHFMLFDASGMRIHKYWSLTSHEHEDSPEQTVERVRELVIDSIKRQLVSDVPVCSFLSGGLDSSAITAAASGFFKETGRDVLKTYSIDYEDNNKFFKSSKFQPDADSPWVKRVSYEFGTQHSFITLKSEQVAEALYAAVDARDLPGMADIDSSLLLFCREVKKDATVALSGECADEVFGGYPWFYMEDRLNSGTFPWSGGMSERTRIMSTELKNTVQPYNYLDMRYRETLEEVPRLAGEAIIDVKRRELFYLNIAWFMLSLLERKDRMSMACGLEVRVPFCDHRLVQYVWNIPWEVKSLKGREKGLLRQALEGILPEDVLWRKKSPYPKTHNPIYEHTVRKMLTDVLSDSSSPLLPLIDKEEITLMLSEPSDYSKPWFGQLMARPQLFAYLIQVDYWMRKYKVSVK